MKTKIYNISKSQLSQFLSCEKQYELQRILKLTLSNGIDVSSLVRGIAVHSLTEKIDKGESVTREDIETIFLDVVSSKIGKGLEVDNLLELSRDFDIKNKDSEKFYQQFSLNINAYRRMKTKFKDKLDGVLKAIPAYVELYKESLQRTFEIGKKIIDVKIENRENLKLEIIPGHIAHLTSILDRVFFISASDIIKIESEIPTSIEIEKKLFSFTVPTLQSKAANYGIQLEEKGRKRVIIDKILPFEIENIKGEIQKEHEERQKQESNFLHIMGYEGNDMVPVILEIKTGTKTKTLDEVKKLIDSYIYSMLFWIIYRKVPVFQIVNLVVTPAGNTKIQRYNIFMTENMLKTMKKRFISICKRIFVDGDFQPCFTGQNFLCSPDRCQYWNVCQKDMTLIAQIL